MRRPEASSRRSVVVWCGCATVAAWVATLGGAARAEPSAGIDVRVEATDGTVTEGRLVAIDRSEIRLDVAAAPRSLAVAAVRRIVRRPPGPAAAPAVVDVVLGGGGALRGDDFLWEGDTATIVRGGGRITLPIDRVSRVAWNPRPAVGAAAEPAWLAAVPAEPAADLVAVARGDEFELVECAITGVTADSVSVVLDGERIPVKRAKVSGLVWLRQPTAASGARVTIDGGSLSAAAIEWTPDELVLDGGVRMPGMLLESVDFAAGRTVGLASLEMEKVTAEPFFGGLSSVEGLGAFFAPRLVPRPGAADSGDGVGERSLLMRPRTLAVWRVPADSRRFHAGVVRATGGSPVGAVNVVARLDDTPVWERRLDASAGGAVAIDVDVAGGRRLALAVEFVPGDMGCAVRFDDAAFER